MHSRCILYPRPAPAAGVPKPRILCDVLLSISIPITNMVTIVPGMMCSTKTILVAIVVRVHDVDAVIHVPLFLIGCLASSAREFPKMKRHGRNMGQRSISRVYMAWCSATYCFREFADRQTPALPVVRAPDFQEYHTCWLFVGNEGLEKHTETTTWFGVMSGLL